MVTLESQVTPRPQLLSILSAALDPLRSARIGLSTIFFIHGVIGASWVSRLPFFQQQYDVGPAALSVALFCCAAGAVCAMPMARKMHFGSKRMTLLFTLLQCLFVLLLPIACSFPLFCGALLAYGFVASCMNINMNAHAVHIERLRKAPIMSSFHGFCSLGCMAGALLGSLAAQVSVNPQLHFMIIAPLMMVVAYSVRTGLLGNEHTQPEHRQPEHRQPEYRQPECTQVEALETEEATRFSKPNLMVLAMCLIALCSYVSEGAMGDWTTIYLHTVLKSSEAFAALGFSIFSVAMCIGRFAGDIVIKRFGPVNSVRGSASLALVGLATALLAQTAAVALCAFAAVGLGLSIIVPTTYSTTAKRASNAGAAIALVSLFGYAGVLGGPPVIGFTAELTGLRAALSLICFMILMVVILSNQLSRESENDATPFISNDVALDI